MKDSFVIKLSGTHLKKGASAMKDSLYNQMIGEALKSAETTSKLFEVSSKMSGTHLKKGGASKKGRYAKTTEGRHYQMYASTGEITIHKVVQVHDQFAPDDSLHLCEHGTADVPQFGWKRMVCMNACDSGTTCTEQPTLTVLGLCADCMHRELVAKWDNLRRLLEMERRLRNIKIGE
jgi:hypothetical protein